MLPPGVWETDPGQCPAWQSWLYRHVHTAPYGHLQRRAASCGWPGAPGGICPGCRHGHLPSFWSPSLQTSKRPWPLFVGAPCVPSTVVTVPGMVRATTSYRPPCPAPGFSPGPLGLRGQSSLPTFPALRLGAWCRQPSVWPALPASSLTPSGAASATAAPPRDLGSAQRGVRVVSRERVRAAAYSALQPSARHGPWLVVGAR